jgi:hypothetical protein
MRDNADPPNAVGGLEGIVDGLDYLFRLAHEDASGVGWIAAVEGEQQIQSWEVKDINLRATAWACAGKNVCNAISVAIVDANANAAGKVFCVGHELGK